MGTLNVNLQGSPITPVKNCYQAKPIISASSTECININGGVGLDTLNSVTLDTPNNPAERNVYSINIADFLPLVVEANTTCNGYYSNNYSVNDYYSCNKKINEANIPYIHGELVNKGTIPSSVLPTTCSLGSATSNECVITKRAALGLTAQTARAISYDAQGWLNLWGYGNNGCMYIISSAQVFQINEGQQILDDLACAYPQSGG